MNTNKTNTKGGAKEVTTPKTNNTTASKTANGKTPAPKTEEKKTAPKVVELPPKPKTIEEQLEHFEGLERLIKNRRILVMHLNNINRLEIEDNDILELGDDRNDWAVIKLIDKHGRIYDIEAPALVHELRLDLIKRVEDKVFQYDQKILSYTQN